MTKESDEQSMNHSWKVHNRTSKNDFECALIAYWEVSFDPISDDYTPEEIDAYELLKKWLKQVQSKYPNGLVPIYWSVKSKEHAIFEFMPFQFKHSAGMFREDFLTFFTWPVNSMTGERLNWLMLPVADKLWNSKRADKGGFIQEATGWKPAVLQPYIYLPALMNILDKQQ
ncbi:hypothetical protein NDI37_22515 [Funiculus sociatus GB2-A5]|uniref:Uncharacterized protein n=1 Tax=Funiculus sociatus GB2-A5 TaxID=2933946 RepID=A0ABV0JUV2_9CYAN|nr:MULTISPECIES: hypothetical protein [unclassified Trichocoleus]MBD1906621.1 hypothetical protein [Trichocoleus sp. FACHB-832]MBD2061524.1 hypothetical protein [Trichocoleus sp. FACHB-6]